MRLKQTHQPCYLYRSLVHFRDLTDLAIEHVPELLPQFNVRGVEMPILVCLDTQQYLYSTKR